LEFDIKWSDILKAYEEIDKNKFIDEYFKWGKRFLNALNNVERIDSNDKKIAIIGMGGSGIVGDIINDCFKWEYGKHIEVFKIDTLPKYIDKDYLVICVSFSGNTIETLSSLKDAIDRGAEVIGVSKGGKLLEMSKKYGFKFIPVEDALAPRAGLPQLLGSVLKLLSDGEYSKDMLYNIGKILDEEVDKYRLNRKYNRAFKLAYYIWGRQPILYANSRYVSVLHRAKSSFNENSKISAYYQEFPEGYHNEVEIYSSHIDPIHLPVILDDDKETLKPLMEFLETRNIDYIEIIFEGKSMLEKILRMIILMDIASIYLSYLRKIDPLIIESITELKGKRG
jgi:glucose/mannose-6-phosphate isomerase